VSVSHGGCCGRFGVLALGLGLVLGSGVPGRTAELVEPSALTRRPDLLGRLVVVDDRVRLFQWHRETGYYDEISLRRTPVIFRLGPRLRFEQAPGAAAVRVEGVLGREGDRWVCDVTALELLPKDLERIDRELSSVGPRDAEQRTAWARWAEQRGRDFKDEALLERARQLETEAVRIEAERPSKEKDPPRRWLELAQRAREHKVPEPEPSALAHRAFAARFAAAETVDAVQSLVADIEAFWPGCRAPLGGNGPNPTDLQAWLTPYARDPAAAYRSAPEPVRAALDHRLWADVIQRLAELRINAEPQRALEYARTAAAALPDRPEPVARLLEQGLKQATENLNVLRQADVEELARVYQETLHRPEAARDLIRRWLDNQRDHRLSSTDAEGRVLLAQQYDTLLKEGGRAAAVALLQDAWRIDPQSRQVAEAFRQWGFRKVNDQWVEPASSGGPSGRASAPESIAPAGAGAGGSSGRSTTLLGLTPQQVRLRMGGKPDRIVWSASQSQLVEQWIYQGVNQDQYLNFLHTPGDLVPKLVAYYSRPRSR
jgi:hypothetical protein